MNLAQFVTVFKARKRLALAWLASCVGLGVVLTLLLPDQFRGDAQVVVDVKPDPVSGVLTQYSAIPAIIATQLDIIDSDRVARRVVRDLRLDIHPDVRGKWQDETDGKVDFEEWAALLLQKHLDARPSRESNVITIRYTASDAAFAARVANAYAEAYLATLADLRVEPARQYGSFFDKQVKEGHDAITAAQARLSEVQRAAGVTATDEHLDVENARLAELQTQLVAMQTLASDTNGRQAQARAGEDDRLSETLNSPVIANLKIELGRAEANLQQLGTRLGDNNPQVVESRAQVAELRERMASETRRISGGVGIAARINESRVAQMQAELDTQRAKVLKMREVHDRIDILQQDVASAQRNLDAITLRQGQVALVGQSQQSDVHLLSPAVPPIKAAFPNMLVDVLAGLLLGGMAAVIAVLTRERSDRRVRGPQDLADVLGLPVLGVLPAPSFGRVGRRTPALSPMAQRMISGHRSAGRG